ncbi:MAG: hypothetical protein CVV62_00345 [Tenericutes bacterium HGW-Tenericutes-7]|nr:MAG: hypothetical protein CVV62_00345 [Tenericutes bacterium HGW-Tenericutes-7]
MVIDEVLANYDTYMAAADIMNTIGMNVIDEFLTTSGQMLLDLYDIMENGSGDFDDPLFVADIQAIFAQMTDYVDVITSELDSDSIHTLLSALSVAIKIELMMVSDLDDADIEELIDLSLVPATALLDIMFTFMVYIDDQTAIDLLLLGNEMIIRGEYVVDMYGYGYYEPNSIDFPVAVEFVVYLGNFLRDFQTDHMATLEAFNDLFTDGDIEDLITLVTGLALDQMELEMDPADFEMVSIVVDDVLADYDDIIAALEIIKTIGGNLIDEFLTSEGELFLDLYDLMNNVADPSNPAFIYDILDLFGQFVSYNTAVMGELDAASIQQLLGLVRIPLKVQLMMEEEMTETEAEAFITAMMTPVATALANVVTLEQALVASIDGMDATIAASALWTSLTEEERLMALAVKTLDDMLTTANESLIFATITIIQNDILKNADMLLMTGMVAVDIDAGVADLVSLLTDIFAEVHVVADFNFLMITGPQITQLHELFEMLPSGDTPT